MARHPLAFLRTSAGLSHPAYARLIADTHAGLGFGNMAARREKVSRWESGRTVPELSTQLAIAHVHKVAEQDVRRLGWPHWLHLATDAALLDQPWTPQGAIDATRRTVQPWREGTRSYLTVTGAVLDAQIKNALTTLAASHQAPSRDGHQVTPEILAGAEARTQALEAQEAGSSATPMALHYAAQAEHRLISGLSATAGYDRPTGTRLLLLATRTASLSGCLSGCLGDEAGAERYLLAAIRTAAAAGSRQDVAACMGHLATRHLTAGDARDARCLANAAQTLAPRLPPHFRAYLLCKDAIALARLGETTRSMRALDRAAALVTHAPDQGPPPHSLGIRIDGHFLSINYGNAWRYLGNPRKALLCLAPLLAPPTAQPPPQTGRRLLYAVDAHLSLGDLDAAVEITLRAVALLGTLPPGLAGQCRRRFTPHLSAAPVNDLLRHLEDRPTL